MYSLTCSAHSFGTVFHGLRLFASTANLQLVHLNLTSSSSTSEYSRISGLGNTCCWWWFGFSWEKEMESRENSRKSRNRVIVVVVVVDDTNEKERNQWGNGFFQCWVCEEWGLQLDGKSMGGKGKQKEKEKKREMPFPRGTVTLCCKRGGATLRAVTWRESEGEEGDACLCSWCRGANGVWNIPSAVRNWLGE